VVSSPCLLIVTKQLSVISLQFVCAINGIVIKLSTFFIKEQHLYILDSFCLLQMSRWGGKKTMTTVVVLGYSAGG